MGRQPSLVGDRDCCVSILMEAEMAERITASIKLETQQGGG